MSLADKTVPQQTETIAFEFDLLHPAPKVWRALTDPALLTEWLLPVLDLQLEPGARFTFRTQPQPGWDGAVHCRIIDVDLHKRLSYSWDVGDVLNTVVTFTLTPTPAGTQVRLVQSGFTLEQKRNFGGARYGWRMMGEKLVDLLERMS